MYITESEVTSWMESRGYCVSKSLNKVSYYKDKGKIRLHVDFNQAASDFCYSRNEYRHGSEGQILNEKGKIAKEKDVILRATNGYILEKMGKGCGVASNSAEYRSEPQGITTKEDTSIVKRKSLTKRKKEIEDD